MFKRKSNPKPVDSGLLKTLHPFAKLEDDQLIVLAGNTLVERASAGTKLIRRGTRDGLDFYLLEGRVVMEAEDGREQFLVGGSAQAKNPMARLRPRKYTVTALTPVRYVQIDSSLLPGAMALEDSGMVVVEEQGGDQQIALTLRKDLEREHLSIPSLPEVAIHIQRMMQKETTAIAEIARIVEMDPAITLKLIKSANSPIYRGRSQVDTCAGAIVRLGLNTTRQLVMCFAMHELFNTRSLTLRKRMEALWNHSIEVAAIAFVLAKMTPSLEPERAMVAGLIHDVGAIPILNYIEGRRDQIGDDETLIADVLSEFQAEVGSMILEKWRFPEDFVDAARDAENWSRDSGPEADYCDLIIVSQLHYFIGRPHGPELPAIDDVPAYTKLASGKLGPKLSLEVLHAAQDQIVAARKLLIAA